MNWSLALTSEIEYCVSGYLGRPWHVAHSADKSDRASHPAAVLSDGAYAVFVKLGQGAQAADQIEQEAHGLRLLSERGGARTPQVLATLKLAEGDQALLVMEAIAEITERTPEHWRQMGRALAQLHQAKGESFGLDTHCYWGSLYQDNTPHHTWPEFFWQRRMTPRLQASLASGNLPSALAYQVEALRATLATCCGPAVAPVLLHGDAQQNNFLCTAASIYLVDPSAYYGHPEIDLAHVDFFAPAAPEFFQGYAEVAPIDAGFAQRRDFWRIPAWLAMIEVDGPQHIDTLKAILRQYV